MTEPDFRALQRRARRQERARQWPALDLQLAAALVVAVVYALALVTAPLWWWP